MSSAKPVPAAGAAKPVTTIQALNMALEDAMQDDKNVLMLGEDVFYWGKMMAGALMTALPPVIMYTLAQRLVIRGLTVGGVKG